MNTRTIDGMSFETENVKEVESYFDKTVKTKKEKVVKAKKNILEMSNREVAVHLIKGLWTQYDSHIICGVIALGLGVLIGVRI